MRSSSEVFEADKILGPRVSKSFYDYGPVSYESSPNVEFGLTPEI
jgi:hypothetical protein